MGMESGVIALGIRPLDLGSSGTIDKNVSSIPLKSSKLHLVIFLISLGSELKSCGPSTWKLDSLFLFFVFGMESSLPLLEQLLNQCSSESWIPGFATKFSNIFHVFS